MAGASEVAVSDMHARLVSAEAIPFLVIAVGENRVFADSTVDDPGRVANGQSLGHALDISPEYFSPYSSEKEILPGSDCSRRTRDRASGIEHDDRELVVVLDDLSNIDQ
jgi:hypothetical protein